ncbi:hypothetical protein Naga_100119g5 [Nannochloropsis gaditana]|uniref:Uncharacterized protein n=1 Tax=Nannochloropsis gaditana TaxID=72520 RepID=W7U8U8_9STRA|nr:hypothetical protein Naga_100119g5 [Nannochloropsis gaditana]
MSNFASKHPLLTFPIRAAALDRGALQQAPGQDGQPDSGIPPTAGGCSHSRVFWCPSHVFGAVAICGCFGGHLDCLGGSLFLRNAVRHRFRWIPSQSQRVSGYVRAWSHFFSRRHRPNPCTAGSGRGRLPPPPKTQPQLRRCGGTLFAGRRQHHHWGLGRVHLDICPPDVDLSRHHHHRCPRSAPDYCSRNSVPYRRRHSLHWPCYESDDCLRMGCAERRLQDIRPLSGLLDRADCGCCVGDSPVRCVSGLVFRRKKEKQSGLSVV